MQMKFNESQSDENPEYLTKQLITYLGNKRALLDFIGLGLNRVRKKLDRNRLRTFDVFSGSGIVARYLKQYSDMLIVNDMEDYSRVINNCYLRNKTDINNKLLLEILEDLQHKITNKPFANGFIKDMYSPSDDMNIHHGERVFYTARNAAYLDNARQHIESITSDYRDMILAPLLSEASIHANTSGVFKGFYKNRTSGIGKFGGNNSDALSRILGNIELKYPVLSNYECEVKIHQGDSNKIAEDIPQVDVAYLDPPYNQHPYGSNYFMLNLLVNYKKPKDISPVSGIPVDWNRSSFNVKRKACDSFQDLTQKLNAKYLLVSFNSEGFISMEEMIRILEKTGKVEVLEKKYNTYRGSRNLKARDIHVKEYLYLVEKR